MPKCFDSCCKLEENCLEQYINEGNARPANIEVTL